ncbi:MAG TPA: glycosyl hydrolase [Phycisphaerae bacterium]
MKISPALLALCLTTSTLRAADPYSLPWQHLSNPTVAQVAANFATPPTQYGISMAWGWAGDVTPAVIASDLDYVKARGIHAVTIECGRITTPNASYLTPGYFDLVKTAVAEAKKRGLHIWFINESKYPSGFAGGKFSSDRPDLRMQLMTNGQRFTVASGQTLDQTVAPETIVAIAINPADSSTQAIPTTGNKIHWTAPAAPANAQWQIVTVQHIFDTAVTRSSTSPNGAKDKHDSLMDYLNPAATKQFLAWTEEQYKAAVGDEFGKTLLGFRGDEPEYPEGAPQPFTPAILDAFQQKKGYDPRPWLSAILSNQTDPQRLAHADYVDVWSDLYRDNYFKLESEWCAANNLEFQVHIDHEERQLSLVRSDGDFFKCMRYLGVPGIDTIQNQITPGGPIADFPKFASSCAHLNGRPTAWCEAFAAYQTMNLDICKWVTNHLLVRGINRYEYMFNASGFGARGARGYIGDPAFPAQAAYVNRACYLMAQGMPAASIALYCPTTSFWLADNSAYQNFLAAAQSLLEHQHDCDFIDEQALSTDLKLDKGQFINASGQAYGTLIIPQCDMLSKAALTHLQSFAKSGGTVIILGHDPSFISDKNFLNAVKSTPADFSFASHEPASLSEITLKKLPTDLAFSPTVPSQTPPGTSQNPVPTPTVPPQNPPISTQNPSVTALKYTHRSLADGELYMLFNESDQPIQGSLTLTGTGQVQQWDPVTAQTTPNSLPHHETGHFSGPITLAPHESRFYITTP